MRWYQGGLNYYYYEIHHNDMTNVLMDFGKYGIVRNNWYSLTLSSVNGAGTPWYPEIIKPGPGDPDPTDPIDQEAGYLGIEVQLAPWILWTRDIDI
ncbi:MAG: fimbria major subunit [Tannerellaceae bacterium]|nr:fimbria major subunit [Tannerellaceae bacterium]